MYKIVLSVQKHILNLKASSKNITISEIFYSTLLKNWQKHPHKAPQEIILKTNYATRLLKISNGTWHNKPNFLPTTDKGLYRPYLAYPFNLISITHFSLLPLWYPVFQSCLHFVVVHIKVFLVSTPFAYLTLSPRKQFPRSFHSLFISNIQVKEVRSSLTIHFNLLESSLHHF